MTYPGTSRSMEPLPWDAHPRRISHEGVEREYFTIGNLAYALGKQPVTIRSWITKGIIPKAPYRQSIARGTRGHKGPRLWTRAQVEAIVRIAEEEGVLTKRPTEALNPQFQQRVFQWFNQNKGA